MRDLLYALREKFDVRVIWPVAGLLIGFGLIGITNWLIELGTQRETQRHVERAQLLTAMVNTELGAKIERIRATILTMHSAGMAGRVPRGEFASAATNDWPVLRRLGISGFAAIDIHGKPVFTVTDPSSKAGIDPQLLVIDAPTGKWQVKLAPPVSTVDGTTLLPLVFPLDHVDRQTVVALVALVEAAHFRDLQALSTPPADINLEIQFTDSRFPLASTGFDPGQAPDDGYLRYELRQTPSGSFRETGPSGTEFQTAYASLGQSGPVLVGRLSLDTAMAAKRSESQTLLTIAMAVSLVLQLVAVHLLHYMDRLHQTTAGLREAESLERQRAHELHATLDAMIQGAIVVDAERRIAVSNAMFQMLGKLPDHWIRPNESFDTLLDRAISRGDFPDVSDKSRLPAALTGLGLHDGEARHEHVRPDGVVLDVRTRALRGGGFIVTLTDITEHRRSLQRIRKLAAEDSLTQLSNRRQFHEELAGNLKSRASGELSAVLLIDLDRFKQVNDTLGHPIGDKLLQRVAERLAAATRTHDLVARLGGDEFAILQRDIKTIDNAARLAERIVRSVSAPYDIDGHRVEVGASIGIAIAPQDGHDSEMLLKAADVALYHGKSEGRGAAHFFDPAMREKIDLRRDLETQLERAVRNREFETHFQPIHDIGSGHLAGFEALCRWRHPVRGLVSPADFIPVAEETGLIVQIGNQVLENALQQAANWPEDVWIAVNLSPVQLKNPGLLTTVLALLEKTGVAADRLEFEITEAVLLQNDGVVTANLDALDAAGIRLAIDDFGTGYSSLSYLQRFPFKKVKIDRSFITDIAASTECQAIVEASAMLANRLGLSATAEGIETAEELDVVKRLGCNQAQGYLLGRPVDAAQTRRLAWRDDEHQTRRVS